jgi:hypothetical protein
LTLRQAAEREGISASLIIKNALQDASGFGKQYAHAMSVRTDLDFESLEELAATPAATILTASGQTAVDNAWVNLLRLRVDTRKWALSKRNPKKYGEHLQVDGQVQFSLADSIREARARLVQEDDTPLLEASIDPPQE